MQSRDRIMQQSGDWTPFVIPWSWYLARRFDWHCPQKIMISCVVDGITAEGPTMGAVVQRDKQLGFVAQLNLMGYTRPFLGMHLTDIAQSDTSNPSHITFYLTRGLCPCQQRLAQGAQPPAACLQHEPTPTLRHDGGRGPSSSSQVSSSSSGKDDDEEEVEEEEEEEEESQDEEEGEEETMSAAVRDLQLRPGMGSGSGRACARGLGRSARGRRRGYVLSLPAQGPGAPQQRHCRCPCHAGKYAQVLVSREEVEEMEEKRRAGRPRCKQITEKEEEAERGQAPAAGRPLPRMTASPAATTLQLKPGNTRYRPPPSLKPKATNGNANSSKPKPGSSTDGAAGGNGSSRLADTAGYRDIGGALLSRVRPSSKNNCFISPALLKEHFPGVTDVPILVEIDGVVPADQKPFRSHVNLQGRHCRLKPTPPLAVGRFRVGWGRLPGGVLVMRVVSRAPGEGGGAGDAGRVLGKRRAADDENKSAEKTESGEGETSGEDEEVGESGDGEEEQEEDEDSEGEEEEEGESSEE